jgi:hypothetical protein
MTSTEKNASTTPTAAPAPAAAPAAPAKTVSVKKPARKVATKPAAKAKAAAAAAAKPAAPKTKVAATKKPAARVQKKTSVAAPKPAAKPSAKPVAKPVVAKATKAKKPKMVRDSFTIPKPEYDVLNVLKLRAAKLGNPVKKTELIRAGVKAIAALSDAAFKQALLAVPSLKTGRPAKAKKA